MLRPEIEDLLLSFMGRGITCVPDGDVLIVEPVSKLTDADRALVRQHKSALLAQFHSTVDNLDRRQGEAENSREVGDIEHSRLLAGIADAIASASRGTFLDDLAFARAAHGFVEIERTIRGAPAAIRAEASATTNNLMDRVANAIGAKNYASAYDLLDDLIATMPRLRAN